MKSIGITPNKLDQDIQKLREEFNKRNFNSENHPKTSHEYKRVLNNKKISRTNKTLSANKFKWGNINKLSDKEILEFSRKHPGYLYYKEILANMKIKSFINQQKKRAFTGNKKLNTNYNIKKLSNTNYNHGNKYSNKYTDRNDNFPKINKTNYNSGAKQQKWKNNIVKNFNYNFNYNNYNYNHNHNYNYNINNININIKDKKNPYSLSWVNKILNQNDYKLEIKEKEKPKQKQKLASINPKNKKNEEEIIKKNNFSKEGEEKNKEEVLNENKEDKDEDLDEEQQMQFYKNQKNFFKARKDIKEEPEDMEEDNDEDTKNKKINDNNVNNVNNDA